MKCTSEAYSEKVKMEQGLETMLGSLNSDRNRLDFLRKIYAPGNTEVADNILALTDDSEIMKRELAYASEHGNYDRAVSLAKKFIDHYVDEGYEILLRDQVVGWENPKLADYAITKITANMRPERVESPLETAAEIAKAFGREDQAKEFLERILASQMKRKNQFAFSPAGTCYKLGRYDEAIDLYMESKGNWIGGALRVAKEYKPERVEEVARRGFKEYKPGFHAQELYVECANIIGKTEKAKKTLISEARKLNPNMPPRFYEGLVVSLVRLGLEEEATGVVSKVANYEMNQSQTNEFYSLDNQGELEKLFEAVGDKAPAREAYLVRIERGIKDGWNPSHMLEDIKQGYDATKEPIFLEKKVVVLEQQGDYAAAASLSDELGKSDLASNYRAMHEMVQAVQPAEKE